MVLTVLPLPGAPLVETGDDLSSLILGLTEAIGFSFEDDDIVVVTGKVVSKAEGRHVDLRTVVPSARARRLAVLTEKEPALVELVLRESVDVVRARPGNLIVRHRHGFVSAVAGIDRSNVSGDGDVALLLPEDPDASAEALRARMATLTGASVGIVISDSHGRAFRVGNTGVAIGAAGLTVARSLEGQPDLFGRALTAASVVPIADLVASAAMLVSGEGDEGFPFVVIRGLHVADATSSAKELIRPADRDMFAVADQPYD